MFSLEHLISFQQVHGTLSWVLPKKLGELNEEANLQGYQQCCEKTEDCCGTGCPIDGHALRIPSDASQTCVLLGLSDFSLISKAMELHIPFSNTQVSLYKNMVKYLHRKGAGETHIRHHLVNLQIFIERVLHGRHCVIRL